MNDNKQAGEKQSKKGFGGLGGWFSALMGKPKPQSSPAQAPAPEIKPQTQKPAEAPKPEEPLIITDFSKEDSVKEDMVKFKNFLGKYQAKVGEKMAPVAMKGAQKMSQAMDTGTSVADRPFYKKIIKLFFVAFFVLILVYVGATLLNILKRRGITPVVTEPTPTPIPYEATKPSVYADDEAVLKLEEDINVLENELVRVGLRENDLIPPNLDFDVTFK